MTKALQQGPAAQSADKREPKTVGQIWSDMLLSDSPFAVAYRDHAASVYPNTEPGVDLKLLTRQPGRLARGQYLSGAITRDGDDHYLFLENAPDRKGTSLVRRSPHVFEGRYVNINRRADGKLYPSLTRPPYTPTFTFKHFCLAAAEELLQVAGQIVPEEEANLQDAK